jgi:glycerophosphoryl diester phosphodiesterase
MQALGETQVHFNIETKISPEHPHETVSPEEFVERLLAVIDRYNLQHRVIVQSFDWRTLAVVQQRAPKVRTSYLTAQQAWSDTISIKNPDSPGWTGVHRYEDHSDVPSMVHAAGGMIWSPYFGDLNANLVARSHSLGLLVVPWTINSVKDYESVIMLKVDGLITDYPERALHSLALHVPA